MRLTKFILEEEKKGLVCPLCKHPIRPTGNVGHGCYFDADRTESKIYWCDYCHLEVIIPTEKWREYQRRTDEAARSEAQAEQSLADHEEDSDAYLEAEGLQ